MQCPKNADDTVRGAAGAVDPPDGVADGLASAEEKAGADLCFGRLGLPVCQAFLPSHFWPLCQGSRHA